jgi:hypothetical protein
LSTSSPITPAVGSFVKPVLAIDDPPTFHAVRETIAKAFLTENIETFLKSMTRGNMRIREFDVVLDRGLLGKNVKADYTRLSPGDQGQIREFYLASVEKVTPELRRKFLKLYAYY